MSSDAPSRTPSSYLSLTGPVLLTLPYNPMNHSYVNIYTTTQKSHANDIARDARLLYTCPIIITHAAAPVGVNAHNASSSSLPTPAQDAYLLISTVRSDMLRRIGQQNSGSSTVRRASNAPSVEASDILRRDDDDAGNSEAASRDSSATNVTQPQHLPPFSHLRFPFQFLINNTPSMPRRLALSLNMELLAILGPSCRDILFLNIAEKLVWGSYVLDNDAELGNVMSLGVHDAPVGWSHETLQAFVESGTWRGVEAPGTSPQKRSGSADRRRRSTFSLGQRVMKRMSYMRDAITGMPPAGGDSDSDMASTSSSLSSSSTIDNATKILDFFWMQNEYFILVTSRSAHFYQYDFGTRKLYHLEQLYSTRTGQIIYAKFANDTLLLYEGKMHATVIQFDRDMAYAAVASKYVDVWREQQRERQQREQSDESGASDTPNTTPTQSPPPLTRSSSAPGMRRTTSQPLPSPLTSSSFTTKYTPLKPTKIQFDVNQKHQYVYSEELSIHEIYDRICIIYVCTKKQELTVHFQHQNGSSDTNFTKAMTFNLFGASGRYLVSVMDSLIFVHNIQDKLTMCFDISWKEVKSSKNNADNVERKPVCLPMPIDAHLTSGLREMKETQGLLLESAGDEAVPSGDNFLLRGGEYRRSNEDDAGQDGAGDAPRTPQRNAQTTTPASPEIIATDQIVVSEITAHSPQQQTLSPLTQNISLTTPNTATSDDTSDISETVSQSSLHNSLMSTPNHDSPAHSLRESNGNLTPSTRNPLFPADNDTHSNYSTGSSSDVANDPSHVRMYSRHWKAFEPNFIFDVSSGYLYQMQFSLRDMAVTIRPISEYMNFLLRRRDGKKIFLEKLKEFIQEGESMKEINSTFFLMNKRLKRFLQFKHSNRSRPVEQQGAYPFPVITQRDVYIYVLHPLQETIQEENPSRGINITIEYIRSLSQLYIPIEPFMQTFLIRQLIEHNDYGLMHEFVQYKVISDSKEIATLVYSLTKEYPPAFQIAMDMLSRLKEYELMCECLLESGEVIHALKMMYDQDIDLKPRLVFDAVLKKDDDMLLYNAYEILRALNRKKRGSAKFLPSDNVEDIEMKFAELFHVRTEQ